LPPAQALIEAHQEGEVPDLEGIQANALQYKLAEIESGEMEYEPDQTNSGVNTDEFDMSRISVY
jgi:hypothetical protein